MSNASPLIKITGIEAEAEYSEHSRMTPFTVYVGSAYSDGPIDVIFMQRRTIGGRRGTTVAEVEVQKLMTIDTPLLHDQATPISPMIPWVSQMTNPPTSPVSPGLWGTNFYILARSISNPSVTARGPDGVNTMGMPLTFSLLVKNPGTFISFNTPESATMISTGQRLTLNWEISPKSSLEAIKSTSGSDTPMVKFELGAGNDTQWFSNGSLGEATVESGTLDVTIPARIPLRGDYRIRAEIVGVGNDYSPFIILSQSIPELTQTANTLLQTSSGLIAQLDSMLLTATPNTGTTTTVTKGGRRSTRRRRQKKGSRRR